MKVIEIDDFDWPRCAKCDMTVEQFCVTDTGDALILVAKCHGSEETVTLSDSVWASMTDLAEMGPAFAQGD